MKVTHNLPPTQGSTLSLGLAWSLGRREVMLHELLCVLSFLKMWVTPQADRSPFLVFCLFFPMPSCDGSNRHLAPMGGAQCEPTLGCTVHAPGALAVLCGRHLNLASVHPMRWALGFQRR